MVSIIIPIYKDAKSLEKFLTLITKQKTKKKYELILAIDTNIGDVLSIVEKFISLKHIISIAYSNKRIGKIQSIKNAINIANLKYTIVMSPFLVFGPNMIEDLHKLIRKGKTDLIEFNAKMKKPFKIRGKVRKIFNEEVNIKEHPEVIAYTYPVEFNKLIKTIILKKVNKLETKTSVNSMFSVEHMYKLLLTCETYSSFDVDIVKKIKSTNIAKINVLEIMKQWNEIEQYMSYNFNDEYKHEIQYAHFYHTCVIMQNLIHKNGTSVMIKKVNLELNELMKTVFHDIFDINKYMLSEFNESFVIKKNKAIKDFYKNLIEIEKWT